MVLLRDSGAFLLQQRLRVLEEALAEGSKHRDEFVKRTEALIDVEVEDDLSLSVELFK